MLYTDLFYAIIPTLFSYFFAVLLSLHLVIYIPYYLFTSLLGILLLEKSIKSHFICYGTLPWSSCECFVRTCTQNGIPSKAIVQNVFRVLREIT